ncbi:hypothetical protein TEA_004671 [Camellia sinensis var. sinensis]|uniref:Dehydrogenase E1 component domain-containing protein n=1 Tax=Camellia sinensis var. sinensis TaxID=542762 RepID=A0A4S4DNJ6_CAMSN|nr:hypothetical protein TEA_004671 [Camellia sinensis var. sinensis]
MAMMRRMEIAADSLYKAKLIRGSCHLYDGQEAVAVGMEATITKNGSGFYGGHGIVGAQVPLGYGLAFAHKYSKEEYVTFTMYGDGAANQGQLFEALNMAALWDLPAILIEWGQQNGDNRMESCQEFGILQILEMDTYRYHGHSMSDPGSTYRTRGEITGERQDMEKEIKKEVDEAIAKAKESPMPDPSELFTNVYIKGLGAEVEFFSL